MNERRARRAAGASLLPLLVIAIAFFLPAQKSCGSIDVPLDVFTRDPGMIVFVYPYFAAAILAGALGFALWRELRRSIEWTAVLLGAICAAGGLLVLGILVADAFKPQGSPPSARELVCGAVALVGALMAALAARDRGWPRVTKALAAVAAGLWSGPLAQELLDSAFAAPTSERKLLVGGALYLASAGTLALIALIALLPIPGGSGSSATDR